VNPEVVEYTIIGLILANLAITYYGIIQESWFEKYLFETDAIIVRKEYYRMISSAFLHVNWMHFGFNMFALYTFSNVVGNVLGITNFLIVYFGSLLAGNFLSLYFHRNHGNYRAVGASGAVSGVVFASIVIYPEGELSLILLPMVSFPAWIFGIAYLLFTIYGVKSQRGNIGHDAHLGGAIAGILICIGLEPRILEVNYLTVILLLTPFLIFMYIVLKYPQFMLLNNIIKKKSDKFIEFEAPKEPPVQSKAEREQELNALLEKVNRNGVESLSKKERKRLEELSGEI
jgi:membrane associated rhomboid family serine protease